MQAWTMPSQFYGFGALFISIVLLSLGVKILAKHLWAWLQCLLFKSKVCLLNKNTAVPKNASRPKTQLFGVEEGEGDLLTLLRQEWPDVDRLVFQPRWWLCTGLLQTWFTSHVQFQKDPEVCYDRELVSMRDGGVIGLDWHKMPKWKAIQGRTAVIIPGLTSSSEETYVRRMVLALQKAGWAAVVMNNRGCGGTPVLTPRLYSGGETEDLRFIAKYIKHKIGDSQLAAIGFSLGANILVKYLGEEGTESPIAVAVSVGNPWDLLVVSRTISDFLMKILGRGLTNLFQKAGLVERFSDHKDIDVKDVMSCTTVKEFDEAFIRRYYGYMTVGDYYRDASSVGYLHGVKVPLLALNALDDPISHHSALPYDECAANPFTALMVTKRGGHLGWWEASGSSKPVQWAPDVVSKFLGVASALVLTGKIQKPALPTATPSTEERHLSWNLSTRSSDPTVGGVHERCGDAEEVCIVSSDENLCKDTKNCRCSKCEHSLKESSQNDTNNATTNTVSSQKVVSGVCSLDSYFAVAIIFSLVVLRKVRPVWKSQFVTASIIGGLTLLSKTFSLRPAENKHVTPTFKDSLTKKTALIALFSTILRSEASFQPRISIAIALGMFSYIQRRA